MIKVNDGKILIKGSENTVLAEMALLLQNFKEILIKKYGEEGLMMYKRVIELADLTDEEVASKVKEADKLIHELLNLFS